MSSGISQIEFWREAPKPAAKNKNAAAEAGKSSEGGPGAIYLSYDVFMGLSVLGGALALDHLYLRSPLTFIAKILVNVLTLGSWWLYDASQAVFNKDVVRVFGLGVPGMGPKGIGAGVLASDTPDQKHMAFFIYALALIVGGIFGLDSFVIGDNQTGFIRIICLVTGIFAPIAVIWWLYNLGSFLFNTKGVINQYWQYFGAQEPAEHGMSLTDKILTKFPFLQYLFGPVKKVASVAQSIGSGAVDLAETVVEDPSTLLTLPAQAVATIATGPLQKVVSTVTSELKPAIEGAVKPAINAAVGPVSNAIGTALAPALAAVKPITNTAQAGIAVAQTGLDTVQQGIALGQTVVDTGSTIANKTLNVVGDTAKAATTALTLAPSAAALSGSLTPASAQAALTKLEQKGGGSDSSILSYMFVGTLGIVVVSGLILTYRRSRQNGKPRKDDSPPEPGVLRESDKKETVNAA